MPLIPLVVIIVLEKLTGGTAQPIKVSITSVCSAVRGSGSPKSGIAPEIHVLAACRVCVKPCLVVCFLNVPHGTCGTVVLPAGSGSQGLANGCRACVAMVLVLAADIGFHCLPLCPAWQMPSVRTDTLYARRDTATGTVTMHGGLPIIMITINIHIGAVPVGIITVIAEVALFRTDRNESAIGEVSGPQVLGHPTLRTQLHGVIDIPIVVGDSWSVRTGLPVMHTRPERIFLPVTGAETVSGVCPEKVD